MARYIDADEAKSVINANDWSNPVVPQVVGMIIDRIPTADVAPRSEVAREIFEEIESLFPSDKNFTTISRVTINRLKKKYTEGGK